MDGPRALRPCADPVCVVGSHFGAVMMTLGAEIGRVADLTVALTWRDLRVRYKQSVLGAAWAVLLPLSMMALFTFVFTRAMDVQAVWGLRVPYALYAFAGLVPWTFFSASLSNCVGCLVANRNLVTKVYFPREVFPLSAVATGLADFAVAMLALLGLMLYYHADGEWALTVGPGWAMVPIVLLIQLALTIGLGLLLAMGNLFYRDVRPVFGVAVQLWMFVSGVVVPIPHDGSTTAKLLSLNPVAPLIEAYRACLLEGRMPSASGLAYSGTVALALLVGGWIAFRRAAFRFAECI